MKKNLLLLAIILYSYNANSQFLSVFDLDDSEYPIMKAKFYAMDSTGQQLLDLSPSDFVVMEMGTSCEVISISCPPPKAPVELSIVLTIDNSYSMEEFALAKAKVAATGLVDAISLDKSECAVTTFNTVNSLRQDFTQDKGKLKAAINSIYVKGYTDMDAAFINPEAGALLVAKTGKKKRVVILITDGGGGGNTSKIINYAKDNNITVYCVTLGIGTPQSLRSIAKQTGGLCFDNVATKEEAKLVYLKILGIEQRSDPCTITWERTPVCAPSVKNIKITCNPINSFSYLKYIAKEENIAELIVPKECINFGAVKLNTIKKLPLKVRAYNADFKCTNILNSNIVFDIEPKSFDLSKGETISLLVSYRPIDSAYTSTVFSFVSSPCQNTVYAVGGYSSGLSKGGDEQLEVIHPNGAENFCVGSDTVITWKGIAAKDIVSIEYSYDKGNSWSEITNTASHYTYNWNNIPKTESDYCIMKIKKKNYNNPNKKMEFDRKISQHRKSVISLSWNPNGTKIASSSYDNTMKICDAISGNLLYSLANSNTVLNTSWNPKFSRIANLYKDGVVSIWDAQNLYSIFALPEKISTTSNIAWNPNGTKLVTAYVDNSIKIWNATNATLYKTMAGHSDDILCLAWNSDGTKIASGAEDNIITIWDINTGRDIINLIGHSESVTSISWSTDGTKIISGSNDSSIKIWEVKTGRLLYTISENTNRIKSIKCNPNGKTFASCNENNVVKIRDIASGHLLRSFSNLISFDWSSDGSRIAMGDMRGYIIIKEMYDMPIDISDELWSIQMPKVTSKDIYMGWSFIGNAKDSVVNDFILNKGQWKFSVDSIYFSGKDADAFSLISHFPKYTVDRKQTNAGGFSFKPLEIRKYNAEIVIITQADTLYQKIYGEGVEPRVMILNDTIDFGIVALGEQKDTIQAVTIKNIGGTPLTIDSTKYNYPSTTNFTTLNGGAKFTLQPNEVCKMDLRFAPNVEGKTLGKLQFYYNDYGSPVSVQLIGEGYNKGARIIVDANKFQDIICKNIAHSKIDIKNGGGNPLVITDIKISGTNYDDFLLNENLPITLRKDSSTQVDIIFLPKSVGEKIADIEIYSNSISNSILTIPIRAKKDSIAIIPQLTMINLGKLCPNETKDTILTITNKGTIPSGGYAKISSNLQSVNSEFILDINENYYLNLTFSGLINEGVIDETIVLYDSICGYSRNVQLIGEVILPKIHSDDIVIYSFIGNFQDDKIKLYNDSNRDIIIVNSPLLQTPFQIINTTFPLTIIANDSSELTIRYTPDDVIEDETTILLEGQPCNIKQEVKITGIVKLPNIKFEKPYFGNTLICDSQIENIKISNASEDSNINIYISQSSITGADAFAFDIDTDIIIKGGSSADIPISFSPVESKEYKATINLMIDFERDTSFNISGTGVQITPSTNPKTMTMQLKKDYTLPFIVDIPQTQKGYIDKWEFEIIKNNDVVYFKENSFNPVEKAITWGTPIETANGKITLLGTGRIDVSNGYVGELFNLKYAGLLSELTSDDIYFNVIYNCDTIDFNVQTISIEEICFPNLRLINHSENGNNILTPYPNPITNTFVLNYSVAFDNSAIEIELINSIGQTVKTLINDSKNAGKYSKTININKIPNGLYYIKYTNGKDIKTVKIIIKK